VQCTGGNRQRRCPSVRVRYLHQSQTFSSRISLLNALATTTSLAVQWCMIAWCGSRLPVTAVLSVSRVLLQGSRRENRAAGVTRLGPDCILLYFNLVLSSHCGFFRASVRLTRSLLEHPKLKRWSVDELVVLYVQEDHQSTSCLSALFHACEHLKKGLLLATVRFRCAVWPGIVHTRPA